MDVGECLGEMIRKWASVTNREDGQRGFAAPQNGKGGCEPPLGGYIPGIREDMAGW